jgi:hypothetical protein
MALREVVVTAAEPMDGVGVLCTLELREAAMNLNTVLLVVLVILLLGALPTWPYSADWGYYPSGGLGLLLIILLVLFFARRGPAV